MMRYCRLLIGLMLLFLLTGCSATELEERCFPMLVTVGYDDKKVTYEAAYPKDADVLQSVAKGQDFKGSKEEYEGRLNKEVDYNHLKVLALEEDLLQQADTYRAMLDVLAETENFPRNTYVCVVDDAEDLMELEKKVSQDMGTYLEEYLKQHEEKKGRLLTLGDLLDEKDNTDIVFYLPYLEIEDDVIEWRGYQSSIASKILRFHVLANSDRIDDQSVKMQVRDAVGVYLQPFLEDADSLAETKQIVNAELTNVVGVAEDTLAENGYDYEVSAALKKIEFPEKTYGAYTFPEGEYEALQITIGEGEGQNWWCVLYPNMCFRGSVFEVIEEEAGDALREVLSPWEYASVFDSGKVEVQFKFLEFFE